MSGTGPRRAATQCRRVLSVRVARQYVIGQMTTAAADGHPRGADAPRRGGRATRTHLIDVAERLFAERGIDAVSISEILEAAGQRNKNAVYYLPLRWW